MAAVFPPNSNQTARIFKGSLARTIIVLLLVFSLLPVILIGAVTELRSRQILREQAQYQLNAAVSTQKNEIEKNILLAETALDSIIKDGKLAKPTQKYLSKPEDNLTRYNMLFQLASAKESVSDVYKFDGLMIVDSQGLVLASTESTWMQKDLSQAPFFRELNGKKKTIGYFDAAPIRPDLFSTIAAVQIQNQDRKTLATLIGYTANKEIRNVLINMGAFFPNSKAFLISTNQSILTLDAEDKNLEISKESATYRANLINSIRLHDGEVLTTQAENGDEVFLLARWIPNAQIGLAIQIPTSVVFSQINILSTTNLVLLASVLVLAVILMVFMSTRLVNPLLVLVKSAQKFTAGDWSQRVKVNRHDEIGLLSHTFNQMVDQLSDLYRSLEKKVHERTEQVRAATEVARIATSSTVRQEILSRTVGLLVERFGYQFARMYLIDEAGTYAVLETEEVGPGKLKSRLGKTIRVGNDSLVGWTAANNEARLVSKNTSSEFLEGEQAEELSEIAVPISIGNQVLGVLEVSGSQNQEFDGETVSMLQMLSNQIANSLQNIRLLDSTKVNLEETTIFYRASRQVSHAESEEQVINVVTNTLNQTPYVNGIYTIEKDHISVLGINDPRAVNPKGSLRGISLPLLTISNALKDKNLVIVEDINQPNSFDNILAFFSRRGCRSAAIFPIFVSNALSKIIVIGSKDPNPLSETMLQPLSNLIEFAAITLNQIQTVSTLQDRLGELQTLANLSETISSEMDIQALYRALHQKISETMGGSHSFAIALYNQNDNLIEFPYVVEGADALTVSPFAMGEGLTSHVIRTKKPLLINKWNDEKIQQLGVRVFGKTPKSWLGVPLLVGGDVLGGIVVQDLEQEDRFTERDLNLLSTLGSQIAASIRNAQLLNQMQQALNNYDQERFLLNSLLENIPDMIYFKDTSSQFIRASHSFAIQSGVEDPEQIVGKTDFELFGQELGTATYREEQELLQTGEQKLNLVEKVTSRDGAETYYLNSLIPLKNKDRETSGLLGISRDITDMKLAEQAAEDAATKLRIAAEIARDTASTLDMTDLLKRAVNLVLQRFGFYHASIFLLDALQEFAVLRESTGPAGERLKSAGHRLAVGSSSIVGQATDRKEPVVINDVTTSPTYYANPLLPETRSELAIPLKVGDKVVGALDVQSRRKNAFQPQDIQVLQILADQLAIAVFDAQLFGESKENSEKQQILYQIANEASTRQTLNESLVTVVSGLQKAMPGSRISILMYNPEKLSLSPHTVSGYGQIDLSQIEIQLGKGIVGESAQNQTPLLVKDTSTDPRYIEAQPNLRSELAVPILYGAELIGVLNFEHPLIAAYDEHDIEILTIFANSLGAIIANSRLVKEITDQVNREHLIYEASSRIRRSVDIQTILDTSVAEICRAVGAGKATIEIEIGSSKHDNHENPQTSISPKSNGNGRK